MTYARRVDSTQEEIVRSLRQMGAFVWPLHREGQGCPDLLCGWRGRWFLFEVKGPKGRLTQDQQDWCASLAGRAPVYVVTSPIEAINAMQGER